MKLSRYQRNHRLKANQEGISRFLDHKHIKVAFSIGLSAGSRAKENHLLRKIGLQRINLNCLSTRNRKLLPIGSELII